MSTLSLGFIGVAAGLLAAFIRNPMALPYVLRQQDERLPFKYQASSTDWCQQTVAWLTKRQDRFGLPIVLATLGSAFATNMFGDAQ